MALVLVLAVVGVAVVFGMALLSMSSLQSQAGAATVRAVSAEAMAESGVSLALFYLQNPKLAPALNSDGHWGGGSGLSFGADVPGSVDVTVTKLGPNNYEIISVGHAEGLGSEGLRRTLRVRARVNTGFYAHYAAGSTGDIWIRRRVRISGDLQTPGQLTVGTNGIVEGRALVSVIPILEPLSLLHSYELLPLALTDQIPRKTDLKDYRTYVYEGKVYEAEQVPSELANVTLGPTAGNPAGVYWCDGNLDLTGTVRINGTLLVRNGRLRVRSGNAAITPQRHFPALIADQDVRLQMDSGGETLVVNGLAWVGGRMDHSGSALSGRVEVNGALIMGGGGSIDVNLQWSVQVTHVSDNAMVPDLTENVGQVPLSVTITDWNPQ